MLVVAARLAATDGERARADRSALRVGSARVGASAKRDMSPALGKLRAHLLLCEVGIEAQVTCGDVQITLKEDRAEKPARVLCRRREESVR